MNKTIFKFSLPILFAFAALVIAPQKAFSLAEDDNYTVTASVSFEGFPEPSDIYIEHTQSLKILTLPKPEVVQGVFTSTISGINITSVEVLHIYDPILSNPILIATATFFQSDNGTYNFNATINVSTASGSFYYKIRIHYTVPGDAENKTKESVWYIANNPEIVHTPIMAISAVDRIFSPLTEANNLEVKDTSFYPDPMVPKLEVQYYYNTNPAALMTSALILVGGKYEMENGLVVVPLDVSIISYRIGVRYNNEADRVKWSPLTDYYHVPVSASSSTSIGPGETAELPHGDQHYGNTSVTAGSDVDDDTTIIITELPTGSGSSIAKSDKIFVASQDIRKLYKIEMNKSYDKSFTFKFFAGDTKDYEILYRASENGLWRKLDAVKNPDGDGTYTVLWTYEKYGTLSPVNYFAVKTKAIVRTVDSSVRPANRAFMPGGKVTFNNLKDGDSVAIYNLKGRLVKKLVPPQYETTVDWDGRNESGDYVESGSYIYQVKADGKIISGTVAFVR